MIKSLKRKGMKIKSKGEVLNSIRPSINVRPEPQQGVQSPALCPIPLLAAFLLWRSVKTGSRQVRDRMCGPEKAQVAQSGAGADGPLPDCKERESPGPPVPASPVRPITCAIQPLALLPASSPASSSGLLN